MNQPATYEELRDDTERRNRLYARERDAFLRLAIAVEYAAAHTALTVLRLAKLVCAQELENRRANIRKLRAALWGVS